jgi:transcriptional regulator with XRE-family HTH domain
MNTDKTDISAILEKYRLDNLLTFKQLANATGLSETALMNLEKRRVKNPRRITIARIKRALPHLFKNQDAA